MIDAEPKWRRRAFILIAALCLARLVVLSVMDLQPQDAYYWQYSKHLAPGYFDHPPVHAWTCWITTAIFGDNAFGIRFGPWLFGVGLLLLIYFSGEKIWGPKAGFWATMAAGVTPLFAIGSAILTPDPPLLFFWTLAVFLAYIALQDGKPWLWLPVGFIGGLAMLSKYTAVFLGAGFLIALIFSRTGRRQLATVWPWLGLVAAAAAFSPQIIWNAQHEWASFAYQSTRRAGELSRWRLDLLGGMVVSQVLLVSPVLFVGVVWASFKGGWEGLFKKKSRLFYLSAFAVPTLVFFTIVALRYWVKMNWLAPAYIAGIIAYVGMVISSSRGLKVLKWGIGAAAVETVLLYLVVLTPLVPLTGESAYWTGWREIAARVQEERVDMSGDTFIAGWGYKVPSELRFYLPDRPETYSSEVLGFPGLNYEYWTNTGELIGRNCIFVADEREPLRNTAHLNEHFGYIEEMEPLRYMRAGALVTTFRIWRCFGYRGP